MSNKGFYLFGTILCGVIGLAGIPGGVFLLGDSDYETVGFCVIFLAVIFALGALLCLFSYNEEKQLESLYSKEALNAKHKEEKKQIGRFWQYFFILFPIMFVLVWFFLFDDSGSQRECAKDGCTRPAASSGDTIYCTSHSNRCVYCGCYIDADATVCMDCIKDALRD